MSEGALTPWLVTAILILFADYIAITETALASVSKVRMKTLADRGNKRAALVLDSLEHFDRTISTILICTNIAHLGAASIVTVQVTRIWGIGAVTISTFVTSLFVFFFAEMLPKSIAKKYSEKLSLRCIRPLVFLNTIFRPAAAILAAIGNLASRLTKGDPPISVTEDEIHGIIEDMTEAGSIGAEHGDLISSALEFNDVTVESILTPRVDVAAIDIEKSPEEILDFIKEQNHSRIPVYEGSIDNIIGVLRIRRYIRAYIAHGSDLNVSKLLDEPMFVTESAKIDELLATMSKQKQSLVIVSDHYGGTAGIVTIEDILETLVGEIWDEEDEVEEFFRPLGGGRYELDARLDVQEAFQLLDFQDPEDDDELVHKSLNEWALEHFQFMPAQRDSFTYHGLEFILSDVYQHRIRKLTVRRLPESETPEGGEDA
jgi:CBS domain containing-hemolysin-like protein